MKKIVFFAIILLASLISINYVYDKPLLNMIITGIFSMSLASISIILGFFKVSKRDRYIWEHRKEKFRLSYAYLIRIITSDNKFLLVKSSKNFKYQPVGGVYHIKDNTMDYWESLGFRNDGTGDKEDFRGVVIGSKLKKILKKLDKGINREESPNREFNEEVIKMLSTEDRDYFEDIEHFKYHRRTELFGDELFYSNIAKHRMNVYRIYDYKLTRKQEDIINNFKNDYIKCFSHEEILNLGMDISNGNHNPIINEHTRFLVSRTEVNYEL